MNSYSQAGQDRFAWEANGFRKNGVFLDIGCNDPLVHNNTAMLEKIGWMGLSVDIADFDYSQRKAKFIKADARHLIHEVAKFMKEWEGLINYLSLDCDDANLEALTWLVAVGRYRCITVETDVYRLGTAPQESMFNLLDMCGYERYRKDVKAPKADGMPWSEQPFEDWFILK